MPENGACKISLHAMSSRVVPPRRQDSDRPHLPGRHSRRLTSHIAAITIPRNTSPIANVNTVITNCGV